MNTYTLRWAEYTIGWAVEDVSIRVTIIGHYNNGSDTKQVGVSQVYPVAQMNLLAVQTLFEELEPLANPE